MRRLLRICGGIAAALVLLEILVRVATAYAAWTGGGLVRPRILCVGDSATYGLLVQEAESYPAQLQQQLGDRADVFNMGFPGMNSFQLRQEFRRMLETFRPDLVLMLIGVNDHWTAPVRLDVTATSPDYRAWLWRCSHLYRLLETMIRVIEAPTLSVTRLPADQNPRAGAGTARYGDVEFALWWKQFPGNVKNWQPACRDNLRAMIDLARAYGIDIVLLTYGSERDIFVETNHLIQQMAEELSVPVIDASVPFREPCPPGAPCPALVFPDGHPTAIGYHRLAQLVAESLPSATPLLEPR